MRLGHHHCTVYWGGEGRGGGEAVDMNLVEAAGLV